MKKVCIKKIGCKNRDNLKKKGKGIAGGRMQEIPDPTKPQLERRLSFHPGLNEALPSPAGE